MIISMVTLIMSMGIPILLLAFISVLVIFNRKLSKVFRILFVIISIIFLMLSIIVFGDILFCLIIRKIPIYYLSVINIVSQTAITITMLTYIRRALRKNGLPAESTVWEKGTIIMTNKILLIFGIALCAMISIYQIVIISQIGNLDNIKKTLETTRIELNKVSTELSKLKKQNKENMLARIEMQKDRKVSESLESLRSLNTRILELAEQKFTNYFIDSFYLWADYGIAIEIVVVNKNKTEEQKIPVLVYLPLEIKPEDVIEKGQFDIRYDVEKSLYYAELTATATDYALVLPPGGFIKYEIVIGNLFSHRLLIT